MPPDSHVPSSSYPTSVDNDQVQAVRHFNRFYTRRAGVLALSSDLSLTETRVLYELANSETSVASELSRTLGVDMGYLSRILKRFEAAGWISRKPNPRDQRQSWLTLTPEGFSAYAPINDTSQSQQTELLASLPNGERTKLVEAMRTIERILTAPSTSAPAPVATLRDLQYGDLGWVLQQHSDLYAEEYGWIGEFEGLVADVVAGLAKMDNSCEHGWIAEVNGERVGCLFLMKAREGVAKIRLVLLTPAARGHGLGGRMVDVCLAYAREKGYTKVELWTHAELGTARKMYGKRGFVLVETEPHDRFGLPLVGEMWELDFDKE